MNTQDEIMKALLDNPNTQGIAHLMKRVVLPAIAKMPEAQQIEAMGTVRDALSDIAEYEECRHHMIETIKDMRRMYNELALSDIAEYEEYREHMVETIKAMRRMLRRMYNELVEN